MTDTRKISRLMALHLGPLVAMSLIFATLVPMARAQAIAEAAGASSLSSSVAAHTKPMEMPKALPAPTSGASPHIVVSNNVSAVETNRHELEARAGKEAARLLIRSYPSEAQVWIDQKPVGATPLLLIVPAGKYRIELRGKRQENAKQEIALLPKETRELSVRLALSYPTWVVSH